MDAKIAHRVHAVAFSLLLGFVKFFKLLDSFSVFNVKIVGVWKVCAYFDDFVKRLL